MCARVFSMIMVTIHKLTDNVFTNTEFQLMTLCFFLLCCKSVAFGELEPTDLPIVAITNVGLGPIAMPAPKDVVVTVYALQLLC